MDALKRVKRYFTPTPPTTWEKVGNAEGKDAEPTKEAEQAKKSGDRKERKEAIVKDLAGKGLF